jgi:hypothetical protein
MLQELPDLVVADSAPHSRLSRLKRQRGEHELLGHEIVLRLNPPG